MMSTQIYPWQQEQWQRLVARLQDGQMPHAILLEGPEGMGKYQFAQALAQLILCSQNSKEACGHCRHCLLFAAGNHPDFYNVIPEEEGKAIKIQQVRDLIQELAQHSHGGEYQVAIIAPAQAMNRAAANALLKTLEEPSGKVVMILIADRAHTLPATIRSRCQTMKFVLKDRALAEKWLQLQLGPIPGLAFLLASADNAPLKALKLVEQNYQQLRDQVLNAFIQIKAQQINLIKIAAEWAKLDYLQVVQAMQTIVMDVIRLHLAIIDAEITNSDKLNELHTLKDSATLDQWFAFLKVVNRSRELYYAENNVNMQLLLEKLLLQLQNPQLLREPSC